jgi:hypothetical protein
MEPAIPSGSRLRLRCGAAVAPGDVAGFVHDGHVFVHRVLAVAPPFLLARGDALAVPDPPLPLERVFARVESVEKGGAWAPPANHAESAGQRVTRVLVAFGWAPSWTRLVVAALRRLRSRGDAGTIEIGNGP